jgi:polyketide cyclase/dehydrase/lipid transport protein
MPMAEPQLSIAGANYGNRAYKNEAERRAGFKPPREPKSLDITDLDVDTLRLIDQGNGGLIRETPQGQILGTLAYTFIDAPPETVWEVITDFDNYENIFSADCEVESKDGDQVTVNQKTASFTVLGMDFGYELHSRYTLDKPDHLSYVAIDGDNEGSHGDFKIMPIDGGKKCVLFGVGAINMEKDNGLIARIAKTGAFPLEVMLDMTLVQSTLARLRVEAERRNKDK